MNTSTSNHRAAVALIALLVAGLVACHPGGGDDDPTETLDALEQKLAPREVKLVTAEVREEHPSLELVGEIRPFESVRVSNEVSGRIDSVHVEVGDRVNEGDVIVEIDRETHRLQLQQAEANLAAAKAELALAEKDLERKKDLLTDKTIAQAVFDQTLARRDLVEAQVMAAEASRGLAARDLDRSAVRSPSAGSISARLVSAGQWIDVGTGVIDLAISNRLKIAARVPETWATRLSGLTEFEFAAGQNRDFRTAKLHSIEPVVQGTSRSFEVVGTAPADGATMRPGMFATVRLQSPTELKTLWLPSSAIASSDMPQVYLVQDGKLIDLRVQTGRREGNTIEVLSGLTADQPVIMDVSGLTRGLPVTVVD